MPLRKERDGPSGSISEQEDTFKENLEGLLGFSFGFFRRYEIVKETDRRKSLLSKYLRDQYHEDASLNLSFVPTIILDYIMKDSNALAQALILERARTCGLETICTSYIDADNPQHANLFVSIDLDGMHISYRANISAISDEKKEGSEDYALTSTKDISFMLNNDRSERIRYPTIDELKKLRLEGFDPVLEHRYGKTDIMYQGTVKEDGHIEVAELIIDKSNSKLIADTARYLRKVGFYEDDAGKLAHKVAETIAWHEFKFEDFKSYDSLKIRHGDQTLIEIHRTHPALVIPDIKTVEQLGEVRHLVNMLL